jgi:uncharacterized protein (TIGR00296 family)
MDTSLQASHHMCALCFDMLIANLEQQATEPILETFVQNEPNALAACPLFVTWKIGRDKDLRGCIGTFDKDDILSTLLPRYAIISAFNDRRFRPITLEEVPLLHVSVSLLMNFTPIQDCYDWEIGKHGIEIEFRDKKNYYRGTFLPEVSKEQGWDQATTLVQLFHKAGYRHHKRSSNEEIVEHIRPELQITRYESSKISMSYAEYLELVKTR